jgi:hypothetical protein
LPATIISTAVTTGASLYSANKQSKAAKSASAQAAAGADREIAFQREARDRAEQLFGPDMRAGDVASRMINGAMGVDTMSGGAGGDTLGAARADYYRGFDASPFMEDARYGAEQSLNALRSTNAAMGRGSPINSGKALSAAFDIERLSRHGATQNYLASLGATADRGFNASTNIGNAYQGFASGAGNAVSRATALQGQGGLAAARAQAEGLADASGFILYGLGNYQRQKPPTARNAVSAIKPVSFKTPTYRASSSIKPLLGGGG